MHNIYIIANSTTPTTVGKCSHLILYFICIVFLMGLASPKGTVSLHLLNEKGLSDFIFHPNWLRRLKECSNHEHGMQFPYTFLLGRGRNATSTFSVAT